MANKGGKAKEGRWARKVEDGEGIDLHSIKPIN